jgi:hypothetical protein
MDWRHLITVIDNTVFIGKNNRMKRIIIVIMVIFCAAFSLNAEELSILDNPPFTVSKITTLYGGVIGADLPTPVSLKTSVGTLQFVRSITVNANKRLRWGCLAGPQDISTTLGVFRIDYSVSFHENGNLSGAPLQSAKVMDSPLGKLPFSTIRLSPDGRFEGGGLEGPTVVKTKYGSLSLRYCTFWPNSQLNELRLTKELALATPSGTLNIFSKFESPNLSFYEDGSIQYAMLAKNSPIRTPLGIVLAHGGDTNTSLSISWYPNGNLKSILPAEPVSLKDRRFAVDEMINFNKDGSLSIAVD